MRYLTRILRSFIRQQQGVALIEFVLVLPLFLLLVLGGTELARYVLINQKMDKAVYALADVIAQSPPTGPGSLDETSMITTLSMLSSLMEPFDALDRQSAIVTSVQNCPTQNAIVVRWQATGGGVLSNGDTISVVNNVQPAGVNRALWNKEAIFPADVQALLNTMMPDENMIISEVFYSYEPFLAEVLEGLFDFTIEPRVFTRRVYVRPRNGDLSCLMPSFPCTSCTDPITPQPPVGGSCAPGECVPNSLGGGGSHQPCECIPNGAHSRGYNGGPDGCGDYRCNNGLWVLETPRLCEVAPACP
jgi:Flp pilus assembly protein TadG